MVVSFVDRIKQEATRKGGSLSLNDIAALDEEFAQRTVACKPAFEKTFDEYIRAARSSGADWHPREGRAAPSGGQRLRTPTGAPGESRPGSLSRRVLPGFFMAMGLMMGPDAMSAFDRRAKILVQRNRVDGDEPATWDRVMQDPEAEVLRLEALVAIAVHFANPDRRAAWFVDMVNNSLAEASGDEPEAEWRLSRPAYERLIDALFNPVMKAITGQENRENFGAQVRPRDAERGDRHHARPGRVARRRKRIPCATSVNSDARTFSHVIPAKAGIHGCFHAKRHGAFQTAPPLDSRRRGNDVGDRE